MKTVLNILPPEKKEDILLAKRYRMFIRQQCGILFLVVFSGILLFGVWELLALNDRAGIQNFEEKKQKDSVYSDIVSYEQAFSNMQEVISRVENVFRNRRIGSRIFRSLEESVPAADTFSSIVISDNTIKASGQIATRDALLELQENLRKQSCFSDAVLPWSQMAQKENIDFEITITVRSECFSSETL